jgi:hypothetical protein
VQGGLVSLAGIPTYATALGGIVKVLALELFQSFGFVRTSHVFLLPPCLRACLATAIILIAKLGRLLHKIVLLPIF